jgi:hypothetical protein
MISGATLATGAISLDSYFGHYPASLDHKYVS